MSVRFYGVDDWDEQDRRSSSPLAGGIAKAIGKAFKSVFLDAELSRAGEPTGDPWNPTPGEPETYRCKAIVDEWSAFDRANTLVRASGRKVLVLATTLRVEPRAGDMLNIGGLTLTIVSDGEGRPGVATDAARGVWVLRCRV